MQNVTYRFLENSHYYRSFDVISTYIYTFNTLVFLFLVKKSIWLRWIVKEVKLSPIRDSVETLPPFLRVLGFFLFNARLGTSTSHATMFILLHFINLAAQNAAKPRMTIYHQQKSLSNNGGPVVKGLPLSYYRDRGHHFKVMAKTSWRGYARLDAFCYFQVVKFIHNPCHLEH